MLFFYREPDNLMGLICLKLGHFFEFNWVIR
jgi:hypothetical protein